MFELPRDSMTTQPPVLVPYLRHTNHDLLFKDFEIFDFHTYPIFSFEVT